MSCQSTRLTLAAAECSDESDLLGKVLLSMSRSALHVTLGPDIRQSEPGAAATDQSGSSSGSGVITRRQILLKLQKILRMKHFKTAASENAIKYGLLKEH